MSEEYIKIVSRTHQIFRSRSIKFITNGEVVDTIPVPDEQIVCDACNAMILDQEIKLLCYIDDGIEYVWGAICDKCHKKYHSKLKVVHDE